MTTQLPLAIGLRDDAAFANFYAGGNLEAVACLRACASAKTSEGSIFLWGPPGSGKTHLLQAACREAGEHGLAAAYIPLSAAELVPEMLEGLETLNLVCIDDLDAVVARAEWETALFHLYNRMFDQGTQLVVAADVNVGQLGLQLPDLSSRLTWGFVFHLQALSDDDKLAALRLRAEARGMALPDEVSAYLIRRCPRDMAHLFALLDDLDAASLAAQRKLTVPFVREWLGR